MKFQIISIIAATLLGCTEKAPDTQNEAPQIKLQVSPQSRSVSSEAQTLTLDVVAESDWGVTPMDAWVKTSPTGGVKGETTVKVTLEENKTGDQRQTTLLFRTGSQKMEIPVTQHYKVQKVEVADTALCAVLLKNLDKDGDGVLSTKETEGVRELDLSNASLTDISELPKLFPQLESLNVSGNDLTSIDIQLLPKLKILNALDNPSLTAVYVWSDFVEPEGFNVPDGVE